MGSNGCVDGDRNDWLGWYAMWACNICGAEHARLYDARWNCPCRQRPDIGRILRERAIRNFRAVVSRVVLAIVIGAVGVVAIFLLGFVGTVAGFGVLDALQLVIIIQLVLGIIWGVVFVWWWCGPDTTVLYHGNAVCGDKGCADETIDAHHT
jgi:hypothetical protein